MGCELFFVRNKRTQYSFWYIWLKRFGHLAFCAIKSLPAFLMAIRTVTFVTFHEIEYFSSFHKSFRVAADGANSFVK